MKKLLNQKAYMLIEVLLAITIFAAIALPLMSVFLQSVKTDKAARNVLNANYISQDYIEKLDGQTYLQALAAIPDREPVDGYYLSAEIQPYGNAESLCAYAHLVMLSSGKMLAVLPDGKWRLYDSVPDEISMSVSSGQYTFVCAGNSVSGAAGAGQCTVIVNAMQKASGVSPGLTLDANCTAVIYCRSEDAGDIRISGTGINHSDIISGETSLIHVTASVYNSADGTQPIAISEAYINIRNEA